MLLLIGRVDKNRLSLSACGLFASSKTFSFLILIMKAGNIVLHPRLTLSRPVPFPRLFSLLERISGFKPKKKNLVVLL